MSTSDSSAPPNPIFHHGTLQSGIQRAIVENKVVAVFLHTPDEHTSTIWQDYWLSNSSQPTDVISSDAPPLGLVIAEKAVLLKIEAGSKEAGFLKAFVDVESVPCLVVVRNGKVLERIGREVSREEFASRLLRAVGFEDVEGSGGREREQPPEGLNDEEEIVDDIEGRHTVAEGRGSAGAGIDVGLEESTQQESSQQPQPSQTAQTLLADRARRLETERLQREAREKAERTARANARRKEEEAAVAAAAAASQSQSQPPRDKGKQRAVPEETQKSQARDAWIYQQKLRKDEAKKERERILAQIESDRQERKAAAQRRKDLETSAGGGAFSTNPATAENSTSSSQHIPSTPATCALQIRLFDGSSIRGKFASDTDIATAVRTWVREASPSGGADTPFNFRLIQPPSPSRTIEISEEHQSLLELGLAPSATLVLVPVAGATSAYAGAGQGVLGTAWGAAGWVAGGVGSFLGAALGYVPGFGRGGEGPAGPYIGGTGDEQERSTAEGARMAGSDSAPSRGRVKGMGDGARGKEDDVPTFYNGNSSAFQGRKDDDDGT